jgi:hypothetical protein
MLSLPLSAARGSKSDFALVEPLAAMAIIGTFRDLDV